MSAVANQTDLKVEEIFPLAEKVANLLYKTIASPPKVSEKGNEQATNNPSDANTAKELQTLLLAEFPATYGMPALLAAMSPDGSLFVDQEVRAENIARANDLLAEIERIQEELKSLKAEEKALREGKDAREMAVENVIRIGLKAAQSPANAIVGWTDSSTGIFWSFFSMSAPQVSTRGRKPGSKSSNGKKEGSQDSEI